MKLPGTKDSHKIKFHAIHKIILMFQKKAYLVKNRVTALREFKKVKEIIHEIIYILFVRKLAVQTLENVLVKAQRHS